MGASMWYREYRDYKPDEALIKQPVESGRGIVGCEMHEIFGWGNRLHHPQPRKRGFIANLFMHLFHRKKKEGDA